MGNGITLKCKECEYEETFGLGIGYMFPQVYKEVVRDIRAGKYGEEWKKFFKENRGAVVSADNVLYQCPSCNHLDAEYDLSLYVHKDGKAPQHGYWMGPKCDGDGYEFVKSYVHKCPQCAKRMHKVGNSEIAKIPCPKCGKIIAEKHTIRWD